MPHMQTLATSLRSGWARQLEAKEGFSALQGCKFPARIGAHLRSGKHGIWCFARGIEVAAELGPELRREGTTPVRPRPLHAPQSPGAGVCISTQVVATRVLRRDFANGFLFAELMSRYFPAEVALHSFANVASTARKQSNWHLLSKLFKVRCGMLCTLCECVCLAYP